MIRKRTWPPQRFGSRFERNGRAARYGGERVGIGRNGTVAIEKWKTSSSASRRVPKPRYRQGNQRRHGQVATEERMGAPAASTSARIRPRCRAEPPIHDGGEAESNQHGRFQRWADDACIRRGRFRQGARKLRMTSTGSAGLPARSADSRRRAPTVSGGHQSNHDRRAMAPTRRGPALMGDGATRECQGR